MPLPFWSAERERFADRADAGRRLASKLEHLRGADVVVLRHPESLARIMRMVVELMKGTMP